MKPGIVFLKNIFLTTFICFFAMLPAVAGTKYGPTTVTSTAQQAITFLDSITTLTASTYWPSVKPIPFLQNVRENVKSPIVIYAGSGTNFCGYGALSYLLLQDDPLGYAKFMLQLYKEGRGRFGNSNFTPSAAIEKQAGRMRFKGVMDIHPADQLWFLTLADHFKGYLNIFNRKYDPGDEDRFWASVNYAKFNRMVRSLLHFKVKPRGTDLMRPAINDLYQYISDRLQTGKVVLYINNRIVHKKKHEKIKLKVPTHFIVAEKISRQDDLITLVYWDYGGRTLMQLTPKFLKRIVFGITHFTKKESSEN